MEKAGEICWPNQEVDLNAFIFLFCKFLNEWRDKLPLYCWKCRKCGHEQEIVTYKYGEENHMPCEKCGVCLWEKLPTSPAIHFSEEFLKNR